MKNILNPTWMINFIYNIEPEQLKKIKIKNILIDLDNTLIEYNSNNINSKIKNWINIMKMEKFNIIIISNNKRGKLKKLFKKLNIYYIFNSFKPFSYGFNIAKKKFSFSLCETIMIGDQIFTDILGANIFGIKNILVKPLSNNDNIFTKINRFFEKIIIFYLLKMKKNFWKDKI